VERLEALSDPSDELIELARILRCISKEINMDLDPDEIKKEEYTYVQDSDEEEDEEIVRILNESNT
jgi:hypothetical protein